MYVNGTLKIGYRIHYGAIYAVYSLSVVDNV